MGLIRDHASCFGPKRLGSNILINKFNEKKSSFFHTIQNLIGEEILPSMENETEQRLLRMQKEYEQNLLKVDEVTGFHNVSKKELNSAIVSGFDLATVTGPLMDEPMQGAVFILENVAIDKEAAEEYQAKQQEGATTNYGSFAGQVMSTIKSLCKRAFLNADPRIVEGVYLCSMQASPQTYGNVYSVLNKCRSRVIKEDVQDGTNFFLIDALIPLSEGFVFTDLIRKKSCGIAQP